MLKNLSLQKATGIQITQSLTPSQQIGVQKGTAMQLNMEECKYLLSKNIQKTDGDDHKALVIEEKDEASAKTLKSI